METSKLRKRMPVSALTDPEDRRAGDRLGIRQARSAASDQEPGDVRARDRHDPDDDHFRPRSRHRRQNIGFSSRSCCGCGSRCCSPISPKPLPKAAARRRPTSLRKTRTETQAKLLHRPDRSNTSCVPGTSLKVGDIVLVEAGDIIPSRRRGRSKAWPRSTRRRSPANPRRSSANPAATARRSPAARRCCPTGFACASPPRRVRPSSTA